ncbi:MAG TPA: hypothetical protein PLU83_10555 [Phycicoccus sp.]|nr:hypothetical protein [Phycicoccus sp.]
MRTISLFFGILGFVAGLVGAVCGVARGRIELIQPSSSVAVAGLALVGVSVGLSSWQAERRRASEQKQRDAYGELIQHLMTRFNGGTFDLDKEARLRADVTTWADARVVRALSGWNSAFDDVVPVGSTGSVQLTPEQQAKIRGATAAVVESVRKELRVPGVTVREIENALFNKASRTP